MFIFLMLGWWYGRGWLWAGEQSLNRLKVLNEVFSVGILMRTLLSPWKQIQTEKNFQNFLKSSVDNFISRFIGATVRLAMLLAALVVSFLVVVLGLALFIIWPLVPLLIVILPLISLKVIGS